MKLLDWLILVLTVILVGLYIAAGRSAGDDRLFLSSGFCLLLGFIVGIAFFHRELVISKPFNWLARIIWPPGRWIVAVLALAFFGVGLFQFVLWIFHEPPHQEEPTSAMATRCAQRNTANQVAFDDYRDGRFADAIKHSNGACAPQDWQLVFNSYMALYLQNPSVKLKQSAKDQIARFYGDPVSLADPGPLLVALGDDREAMDWYQQQSTNDIEGNRFGAGSEEQSAVRKAYFARAHAQLASANWSKLRMEEKLSKLSEAGQSARAHVEQFRLVRIEEPAHGKGRRALFALNPGRRELHLSGVARVEGFEVGHPDFVFQWRRVAGAPQPWQDEPADAGSFVQGPNKLIIRRERTSRLVIPLSPEVSGNTMHATEFRLCLYVSTPPLCSDPFKLAP
jgi:hypothetical protein